MPVLALGALEPIIIALMALLLYLSFRVLLRAVGGALPNWHIPGFSSLRDWVLGFVESAYTDVKNWVDPYIHAVAQVISYPVTFFRTLYANISKIGHAIYGTIAFIVLVKIPALYRDVTSYTQRLYNQAIAYVVHAIASVQAYALTLYRQAIGWADQLYNRAFALIQSLRLALTAYAVALYRQAISWADQLYNRAFALIQVARAAVAAYALALFRQALAYVDSRIAWLGVHVEQLYHQAISYADAAAKAAAMALLGTLNGAASIAIAQIWPILVTDIDKLADTAAADFTDVVTDLRSATRAIPRDLVGAATLATTLTIPLIKMVERCVIPNCRNLSQFGKDLQDILGLVGGFELAGLLAEMAHNPQGAADEVHSILAGPVAAIAREVESLIGV